MSDELYVRALREDRARELIELEGMRRCILELDADREQLRARILELEAELALLHGSLAQPTSETLTEYTHNLPPDAPR